MKSLTLDANKAATLRATLVTAIHEIEEHNKDYHHFTSPEFIETLKKQLAEISEF